MLITGRSVDGTNCKGCDLEPRQNRNRPNGAFTGREAQRIPMLTSIVDHMIALAGLEVISVREAPKFA